MHPQESYERYHRQMLLKGVGEAGQQKLLQAKVLVIGAGGLGCPVLQYLAAAGVGTIGIVDDHEVTLSNLHRQVLYRMDDIGLLKAERAAYTLQQLNPGISIVPYVARLTNQNAEDLIGAYDIVIDGTDNFPSRYMINDACVLLNKPLVYAAISRFEGQVAVFNVATGQNSRGVNYRDLFPEPPAENEVLNCSEAGVLGVLPGIIGCMQANETIKFITGIGETLAGRLLTYNALNNQVYEIELETSDASLGLIPTDVTAFKDKSYSLVCSRDNTAEIEAEAFHQLLQQQGVEIVDVREQGEMPVIGQFPHHHMPLSTLYETMAALPGDIIVTFCQSGKRSAKAAHILYNTFGESKKIYSLKGGIGTWIDYINQPLSS